MKLTSLLPFILSFSFIIPSYGESSYQGTGAAGTAGSIKSGAINGPSGHESGPKTQDLGTTGNGVGGMGTGTAGDHAEGTRSDTNTKKGHSLRKGNPGNPSSHYRENTNDAKKTATENGTTDKP